VGLVEFLRVRQLDLLEAFGWRKECSSAALILLLDELLDSGWSNDHSSVRSLGVVPGDCVLNDLDSQLVLQWECHDVLLVEAATLALVLLHFCACSHADIFDLVGNVELRKADTDLPHDLLLLEVEEAEPESLACHVIVVVSDGLAEDQWPLESVIVLEPEALVVEAPVLVVLDEGFFARIWRARQLELEEFDLVFLLEVLTVRCLVLGHQSAHHARLLLPAARLILDSSEQHLPIPRKEARIVDVSSGELGPLVARLP
jgi:hypothetical protein